MNEFAAKIQSDDIADPMVVIQINKTWTPGLNRSQVNDHKPMNVDSAKKATKASMANNEPNISPTYLEYADQYSVKIFCPKIVPFFCTSHLF